MEGRPVDLARARREAKKLLRAARGGDPAALARVGRPDPQLSDAQLVVARELGARSWPALVRAAAARDAARADAGDPRALRAAAGADDTARLELLLDAGAPLRRAMALAHAAENDRVPAARLLLERGPEDWGERENALIWATRGEASEEMLRLLVDHGANLEASFDGSSRTPYGLAVRAGRRDLAELLASLGAQRQVTPLDELIGACRACDRSGALRFAADHPQAARLLRSSDADVLVREAARGRRDVVELLLDLGVPVNTRGPQGATALEVAEDASVAALLVERGADPSKRAPVERRRSGEPPFAELEWAAQAAYLRWLARSPLAESRACGDGIAVRTGIEDNTENGVVCSRLDGEANAVIAWMRGAPAQWLTADDDLRERLVAAGASPERTAVVMGAELARVIDAPASPGVTIEPARALEEWLTVAGETALDAGPEELERRAAIIASLGLGAGAPLQLRIARRAGRAIGIASFFVDGETVLGQHLGVLGDERRAGVGRALALACARDAQASGARYAVFGPTPDTIGFHRLLGAVLRPGLRDRSFYLP